MDVRSRIKNGASNISGPESVPPRRKFVAFTSNTLVGELTRVLVDIAATQPGSARRGARHGMARMEPQTQHRTSVARRSATHRHSRYLGDWELVGPLGEGEWSTVLLARPRDCAADWPADYAIKLARIGDARQRQAEQLIAREAMIGRTVTHPHLVAVLTAQVETAPHYLVMPLLAGATLRAALEACGPFATPHALWITRQIGEALLRHPRRRLDACRRETGQHSCIP